MTYSSYLERLRFVFGFAQSPNYLKCCSSSSTPDTEFLSA